MGETLILNLPRVTRDKHEFVDSCKPDRLFRRDWQAEGDGNIAREISTWILQPACPQQIAPSTCPYQHPAPTPAPPWEQPAQFNAPMTTLTGSGRFFVTHHEDGWWETPAYRHLLITNGTREGPRAGRRAFYHLNPEHAQSDANVEIADTSGVEIYGLKSEGLFAVRKTPSFEPVCTKNDHFAKTGSGQT